MNGTILLNRLFEMYDVEGTINHYFEVDVNKKKSLKATPIDFFTEDKPSYNTDWHAGRIRYFIDILRSGQGLEPPIIDNETSGMNIYPEPIVLDGHHRLLAYQYLEVEKAKISYGGRMDLFYYLAGRRKTKP